MRHPPRPAPRRSPCEPRVRVSIKDKVRVRASIRDRVRVRVGIRVSGWGRVSTGIRVRVRVRERGRERVRVRVRFRFIKLIPTY